MNGKLKSLFAAAVLATTSVFGCWFTTSNFNGNYISGINNNVKHYVEADYLESAVYRNGQEVDQPMTVYVKVGPRYPDQNNESAGPKPIKKAVLQYKVNNGAWVTVRTIENVTWKMEWNHPVALFGRNNIYVPGLKKGASVIIRVLFSDGTFDTGDLNADISPDDIANETRQSNGTYIGGWTAPFVTKVIYSGKERPW